MTELIRRILAKRPEYLVLTQDEIAQLKGYMHETRVPVSWGRVQREPEYKREYLEQQGTRRFLKAVLTYNLERPVYPHSETFSSRKSVRERRPQDGVQGPNNFTWRGNTYTCALTKNEMAFLRVALLKGDLTIDVLMNKKSGIVWNELYSAEKRGKISQFLSRLNVKLANAKPPFPCIFSLRRGDEYVTRQDPPDDNPLTDN